MRGRDRRRQRRKPDPLRPHATVTLPAIKPREDRWIKIRGTLRDVAVAPAAVRIYELNGSTILNGYFLIRHGEAKEVAERNTRSARGRLRAHGGAARKRGGG